MQHCLYSLNDSLVRIIKLDGWGITTIPKGKALSLHARYNIAKKILLIYTFKHSQNHIQTTISYDKVFTPQKSNSP